MLSFGCQPKDPRHAGGPTIATNPRRRSPAARLRDALAHIDYALPGSLARRYMRCGKPNCQCKADPPTLHGPYLHWTRTVAGKTVTRSLTEDQAERYQPWFDNAHTIRALLAQLEASSLRAAERTEGWPHKNT
jgi:hypothetical protein